MSNSLESASAGPEAQTSVRPAPLRAAWARLSAHLDTALLVAVGLGVFLLPGSLPFGLRMQGAETGLIVGLEAVAVVLVLRSNRIINFAQLAVGQLGAIVFVELDRHSQFVWLAQAACGCFHGVNPDGTFTQTHPAQFTGSLLANGDTGWLAANFYISLAVSLLLAALLSWGVYALVVSRLERAPRLVATIATIAAAELLAAIGSFLQSGLFQDTPSSGYGGFYVPFQVGALFHVGPVLFTIGDVVFVAVALAVVAAIALFLRRSRRGIAMRGAADNPTRAETLGISVATVSSLSWLIAGVLAGVAGVIATLAPRVPGDVLVNGPNLALSSMARIVAALVFARLTSMPRALVAAVVLGSTEPAFFGATHNAAVYDGVLLLIVGAALALQRHRPSRTDQESAADFLAAREARPIPKQLRHVPVVEGWLRVGAFLLALLVLGFPLVMAPAQVDLGSQVIAFAIVGLSLLVLTGWAGQISLGQFAFAAVGAYVTALLSAQGLSILLCLLGGAAVGAVVAVVVGIPALRLRGLHLAIVTLVFAVATTSIVLNPTFGGRFLPAAVTRPSLLGLDLNDDRVFFYFSLIFLGLVIAAVAGLRRSRIARALIACRDNENAGQSFGINLLRARLAAFAVSGFIAALAGGLVAFHERGVHTSSFDPTQSVTLFLMVVIGGLGSMAGPLIGAAYQGVLVLFSEPTINLLGTGGGVIVVLLLFPGGLGAAAYRVRDNMLRRVATRHRISVPSLAGHDVREGEEDRAPISTHTLAGVPVFVPSRYRLHGQWKDLLETRGG